MNTNHVICRNEVYVEDQYVGKFESFTTHGSARTLGNTALLQMPLYAIGSDGTSGRATSRFRISQSGGGEGIIKVCAEVKVYVWYDTWDAEQSKHVSYDKVLAYSGWIEHIAEGYPSKIYLQDNSFILRFGAIEKAWDGSATIQKIMEDCIPIAQSGFDEERRRLGFTRAVPRLTYSLYKKNVQAQSTPLSFNNWAGRSPFDTMQRLMQQLVLYGGVSNDFNVFIGVGVTENDRPLIALDTRFNVIERDIVPIDGRFVDYDVKVFGILKNGRQYTATGGYRTSKSAAEKGDFEREYGGEVIRGHSTLDTVDGIQKHADEMLKMLREERNKGTIKLLLYPKLQIMDWVTYTDSVFTDLSGSYYILDYEFTADEKGYFQTIKASDKVFVL